MDTLLPNFYPSEKTPEVPLIQESPARKTATHSRSPALRTVGETEAPATVPLSFLARGWGELQGRFKK